MLLAASPLIDVVPGLMIWTLVCFAITFFVLRKFAFGPIQKTIDERRERIRSAVEEAEHARAEARRLLEEHKQLIGQAKSEAGAILAEARKVADSQRERAREEAEADRQRRLEDTRKQIDGRDGPRARADPLRGGRADARRDREGDRQGARPRRPSQADRGRDRRARLLRARGRADLMAVSHRMYARSLFQAARDAGKLDVVHEQLGDFAAAIGEVPELRRVLENPELDPQEKAGILGEIMGDADELLRNFVLLVSEKGQGGRDRGDLPRARRARRGRAEAADRGADDGVRAVRRGGRVDPEEDRAVVRPYRRGDAKGRCGPDRRHRAPGRLAPGRRERQGPPRAAASRPRQGELTAHEVPTGTSRVTSMRTPSLTTKHRSTARMTPDSFLSSSNEQATTGSPRTSMPTGLHRTSCVVPFATHALEDLVGRSRPTSPPSSLAAARRGRAPRRGCSSLSRSCSRPPFCPRRRARPPPRRRSTSGPAAGRRS